MLHIWTSDFDKAASVIAVSSRKKELLGFLKKDVLATKKRTEDNCENCSVTWKIAKMEEDSFVIYGIFSDSDFPGTYEEFEWVIQEVPVIESQEEKGEIPNDFGQI